MADAAAREALSERDLTISQLEAEISRLTALVNASALVAASRDMDAVLRELVRQAAAVLDARAASLLLVDDEHNELVFRVAYGEKGADLVQARFPKSQGIAGHVALTGEPVLIQDAQRDPRHFKKFDAQLGFTTGSLMAVPIQVRGTIRGVLEVLNPSTVGEFTEDDLSMLIAWAGQAGLAMENASRQLGTLRQLETVAESVRDGMFLVDGSGDVTMINGAACVLLGVADPAGATRDMLARMDTQPPLLELVDRGAAAEIEVRVPGERARALRVNTVPMRGPSGERFGAVVVLNDLSAAGGPGGGTSDVVATIAHQLRTPVASIQSGVQILGEHLRAAGLGDDWRVIERIEENAAQLTTLVSRIVDLSQLQAGELEVAAGACSLAAVLHEVAREFEPEIAAAGQTLDLRTPPNLPDVWADPKRVAEVVRHLLDNAHQCTPAGGGIRIRATADPDWATVRVTDTGPGVPLADRDRVFEIFGHAAAGGDIRRPGLGLTLARGIVEAHGGRIWIEDAPEGGAAVAFTLPLRPPA